MTLRVTRHSGGSYEVELAEPEQTWVSLLAGKMLCKDVAILSLAVERGLLELMGVFGKPEPLEGYTK